MSPGNPKAIPGVLQGVTLFLAVASVAGLLVLTHSVHQLQDECEALKARLPRAPSPRSVPTPERSDARLVPPRPFSPAGASADGPAAPQRVAVAGAPDSSKVPEASRPPDPTAPPPGSPVDLDARLSRLEAAQKHLEKMSDIPYLSEIKVSVADEIRSLKSRLHLRSDQVDRLRAFLMDYYIKSWGTDYMMSEDEELPQERQEELSKAEEDYEKNLLALFDDAQIREYQILKVEREAKQRAARLQQEEMQRRMQEQNRSK